MNFAKEIEMSRWEIERERDEARNARDALATEIMHELRPRIASLEAQNSALLADVNQDEGYERLKAALERSVLAIDDWLHLFAAELCNADDVARSRSRVGAVGTLAYIADVQLQNRAALGSEMETIAKPSELTGPQRTANYTSHKGRRMSDSSLYDEVCDDCGARDFSIGPDELSDRPCTPKNRGVKP